MSAEIYGQSPEDRAERYRARAEETRRMAEQTSDPMLQESLVRMIADWEFLASYALDRRI